MSVWSDRVSRAVELAGTPVYATAWRPVRSALDRLRTLRAPVPVRSWMSFKTHPVPPLAAQWLRDGGGIEVVSEAELVTVARLAPAAGDLLVNGVAKQAWLPRHPIPRLRVHFDSLHEVDRLIPDALEYRWRVGVRCHVPDERDARDLGFGGQFGLGRDDAVRALRALRAVGADVQSIHYHLGQRRHDSEAHCRAVTHVAEICADAGVSPRFLDCGGALPSEGDPEIGAAFEGLENALTLAVAYLPALEEVWLENGRFVTGRSAALAVRVLDVKDREDGRYLICDGGRTNQALAADHGAHPILICPNRAGALRLTTVCGPTCMTDDRLGRWPLPDDVSAGDIVAWLEAGAYHLPWETRFSHGLCAVVWFDDQERPVVARPRETPEEWADRWCAPHATAARGIAHA